MGIPSIEENWLRSREYKRARADWIARAKEYLDEPERPEFNNLWLQSVEFRIARGQWKERIQNYTKSSH